MYKLGDEVKVEMIAKITEMYIGATGKTYYAVDAGDAMARRLTEANLSPLPVPEEKNG
jgi:hypothetical protein